MKRLLAIVLTFIIVIGAMIAPNLILAYENELARPVVEEKTIEVATISEDYIPSEEIEIVEIKTVVTYEYSVEELKTMMEEQQAFKDEIHTKAEEYRADGYAEDSREIQELKKQWMVAHARYNEYKTKYQEKWLNSDEFWAKKYEENPTGTFIWRYMKDLGYSDAVCAGIFGNMMLECGIEEAGSFDLKWWVYDSSTWFYGLCQWSKTYFPEVYGMNLEFQMDYLRDTIKEQIDEAGFAYGGDGFGYEEFLQLEDPAEVAVCFAKAYERCASQHVWPRRGFAEQAYAYFTN